MGLDDRFFDAGGHSLLLFRVHGLLRQRLGREVEILDLFRYPTVRALARHLGADLGSGEESAPEPGAAAEAGFRQLLELVKEKPEPFIQYGNFLLEHKHDGDAAIEQYRQALIWKSDDEATRLRIADIYLSRGAEHFGMQHFALADAAFKQAAKWVAPGSTQEQQLRSYQRQLLEIRMPAVR